jgi:hypothetical protein
MTAEKDFVVKDVGTVNREDVEVAVKAGVGPEKRTGE